MFTAPDINSSAVADPEDNPPLPLGQSLTPAERQVMCVLRHGYTNKEIGNILGRCEPTIKHQVSAILTKFGCVNRGRAIALLNRHPLSCPASPSPSARILQT